MPQLHRQLPSASKPALYLLKSSPTTAEVSVSVEHPLPEPPPQAKTQTLKETLGSQPTSNLKQSVAAPSPSDPAPKRPPRKPPDAGIKSYIDSVAGTGAFVGSFLCRMGFQIRRGKIAPMVFAGKTQKKWTFWKNLMCAGPFVADTDFCILFKFQLSSKRGFNMDNARDHKCTYSRNVPAGNQRFDP